jgi:hypothetical protein
MQRRGGRDDVVDAGRHRHRDGHHVVDEQRARHDDAGRAADVRRGNLVVAAAGRIGPHQLPVGQHDGGEQHDHGGRDPRREVQERRAAERQDQEDLLRGVGDAGQRVAREDRQREALRKQGVRRMFRRHRPADDDPLDHAS